MYCRNCNKQYPKGSVFCNICGNALEAPAGTAKDSVPQEEIYIDEEGIQYVHAKPRSKKKIIGIVLASLLSIGLIVGLVCYLIMINDPLYQISNALENTVDELLVNAPTLSDVKDNIRELINDRAFSLNADYVFSESYSDYDYNYYYDDYETYESVTRSSGKIVLNYDADSEEMSGSVSISAYESDGYYDDDPYSKSFDLEFSANDDDIYARLKQLDRNVYALPLANFGEEYTGSSLSKIIKDENRDLNKFLEKAEINPYADISLAAFRDTDAGEEFIDSLQIEESDKKIPHTNDLTVYCIELRQNDLNEAVLAYYEWALTELCGEAAVEELDFPEPKKGNGFIYIFLGINDDDCLVALYAYQKGEKDDAVTIVLDGDENIWDEVVIYRYELPCYGVRPY